MSDDALRVTESGESTVAEPAAPARTEADPLPPPTRPPSTGTTARVVLQAVIGFFEGVLVTLFIGVPVGFLAVLPVSLLDFPLEAGLVAGLLLGAGLNLWIARSLRDTARRGIRPGLVAAAALDLMLAAIAALAVVLGA